MPDERYREKFRLILLKLNPTQVVEELKTKSKGQPVVLLFYEKSNSFCHRRMVADWLNKYLIEEQKVVEFKIMV